MKADSKFRFILSLIFTTAFCSYAYELVLAGILSVLWGNVVLQYTITTGVYIAAMGAGAYFTPVKLNSKKAFIWIEVVLSLLAIAAPLLFVFSDVHSRFISLPLCYSLITLIGLLSGMELPLLMQVLARDSSANSKNEKALFIDYAGMFAAGILFALFLNRQFGSLTVMLILALVNLGLALGCSLFWARGEKQLRRIELPALCVLFVVISGGVLINLSAYEELISKWIIAN
ncbi:hypothetical protein ACLVWU_00430 [Bdellovibrio sp. HCB290]|uniref:hypothetical protein n=1 Tax=Bdellovibrio sp. HCB290 TaxID=3394356 RepID=UPI0039B5A0E0